MQPIHSASLHPARSLRVRAGFVFGLFSAAVALMLGFLLGHLGRRESERTMRAQLSQEAAEFARALDLSLHERFSELKVLAELPAIRQLESPNAIRRETFRSFQGVSGRYAWIGWVDTDGKIVTASDPAAEGSPLRDEGLLAQGLAGYFVGNRTGQSLPAGVDAAAAVGAHGQALGISHAITNPDGRILGAICALVSWDWIGVRYQELSRALGGERRLEMLVLDREGRVLLSPDGAGIDGQNFSLDELTEADADAPEFICGTSGSGAALHFPELGWTVLARQPVAAALAPVARLQRQFTVAGLAGALLAGLLGWALAGRFTLPVAQLAHAARQIADGDPAAAFIPTGRRDEVGELASALRFLVETRERQARELRVSFRHVASTFENAAVGMADIALDGRFLHANRKLCETLGYDRGDLLTKTIADVTHPADRDPSRDHARRLLAGDIAAYSIEKRYLHQGGAIVWVNLSVSLVRDDAGQPDYFVAVAEDTTERHAVAEELQRAKEAAEAASRAKDDFLAALSHELRTPLNPVLMLASELADSPHLSAELREDFAAIRKNVSLEARLIDDLLDLTRITRGKLQLQIERADAHGLLGQAIEFVREAIDAKAIVLQLDLAAPAFHLDGDPVRLQQVFWNVLINAVKFTPPGGMVRVRTRQGSDGMLLVQVTDSGLGIDADDLARIFNSFAQADHGTPRFGGLGLGLSISRLLVQLHEGRIWAESQGRGHGATFFIELPLAAAAALTFPVERLPAMDPAPEFHATALRLLLVEDHEPTRQTLTRLLQRRGHAVAEADCLLSARALAAGAPFDLLISDLGLPDGSGHELMAEMRDLYGLSGIALSGYGMEEDIRRSREAGFHTHLTKPVDMHALEAAIDRVAAPGLLVRGET